jgi:hypothetical protein
VEALARQFPGARVVVADDGSRDATAERARAAGASVLRLPPFGKGGALSLAERRVPPGPLVLADADVRGDLHPLVEAGGDLTIAAFRARVGGGFGVAKRAARVLIRLRSGHDAREPLSGQRLLSPAARAACFPLAPGFGCETRMTIDAVRARLEIREVELSLDHRATGRDLRGFAHRGRQLRDALVACGPLAVNHRGLRLPLAGALVVLGARRPARNALAVGGIALLGLVDDLASGPERGLRAHLRARRTTGVLKLAGMPAIGAVATSSVSGGLLVGLTAHAINLLDTRPGRALKAFLLASAALRGTTAPYAAVAIILLPYDLAEVVMLGDSGSNPLGAVLGLDAVTRVAGKARWAAIGALAGLAIVGEARSLGAIIERTPLLSTLDGAGRLP